MSSELKQALSALLVTVLALSAMDYYFWGQLPVAQPAALLSTVDGAPTGQPLRAAGVAGGVN